MCVGKYVLALGKRRLHLGFLWMCLVLVNMYARVLVRVNVFTLLKWIICLCIHAHVDMLFVPVRWVIYHLGLCERILHR